MGHVNLMKICVRLPFGCAFVSSSSERPKAGEELGIRTAAKRRKEK